MLDSGSQVETTPTAPPLYIPTVEDPTNYQTVVVERTVLVEPPPLPPKDPTTIELEARASSLLVHLKEYYTVGSLQ